MKRYGQHFLKNRHAVERIVETLNPAKTETVVEIGPGKGVLTGLLVARAGRVIAVEVDDPLVTYLAKKFSGSTNFQVVHADIMDFDVASVPGPIKIIGNLPYNLTSPILRKVCAAENWTEAVFMVQKEVGDRLAAQPDSSEYGALTVGVSLTCQVEKIFDLSESSFDPPPRVKSTVVRLIRRTSPLTIEPEVVQKVVQAAFQQRRKTILNALSHGLDLTKEEVGLLLQELHIDPGCRAETISVENYVRLGHLIHLRNSP